MRFDLGGCKEVATFLPYPAEIVAAAERASASTRRTSSTRTCSAHDAVAAGAIADDNFKAAIQLDLGPAFDAAKPARRPQAPRPRARGERRTPRSPSTRSRAARSRPGAVTRPRQRPGARPGSCPPEEPEARRAGGARHRVELPARRDQEEAGQPRDQPPRWPAERHHRQDLAGARWRGDGLSVPARHRQAVPGFARVAVFCITDGARAREDDDNNTAVLLTAEAARDRADEEAAGGRGGRHCRRGRSRVVEDPLPLSSTRRAIAKLTRRRPRSRNGRVRALPDPPPRSRTASSPASSAACRCGSRATAAVGRTSSPSSTSTRSASAATSGAWPGASMSTRAKRGGIAMWQYT